MRTTPAKPATPNNNPTPAHYPFFAVHPSRTRTEPFCPIPLLFSLCAGEKSCNFSGTLCDRDAVLGSSALNDIRRRIVRPQAQPLRLGVLQQRRRLHAEAEAAAAADALAIGAPQHAADGGRARAHDADVDLGGAVFVRFSLPIVSPRRHRAKRVREQEHGRIIKKKIWENNAQNMKRVVDGSL